MLSLKRIKEFLDFLLSGYFSENNLISIISNYHSPCQFEKSFEKKNIHNGFQY